MIGPLGQKSTSWGLPMGGNLWKEQQQQQSDHTI